MSTDAALLAQLQTLWQAAAPIMPLAGPPEPPPIARHGEESYDDQGRIDDQWVLAENAAGQVGIERDDVPLELRWWHVATFDHLPYGDGRLPDQAEPPDGDPLKIEQDA